MEYRTNRRTGDRIGVIGLGTGGLPESDEKEQCAALALAFEGGVNYFDLATSDARCLPSFAAALAGVREQVFYQLHFGADYSRGTYGWTTRADKIKRSVEAQLKALGTDYIDYAFIHCLDEAEDWETYRENGALAYLLELKEQGVARHIGVSSHTPSTLQKILDSGLPDMAMFSINPAYDYGRGDEYGRGEAEERQSLYRRCEAEGVGITVMKPFCGGQLLDAKTSPFGQALTEAQCIAYALDKPGVLCVLPGVRGTADVKRVLGYLTASETERDYSVLASFTPKELGGKCVYCNHCKPCPVGIDIGLVNKYYDLTRAGDALAREHYKTLSLHAGDCVSCGHCDRRCPFGVAQSARMKEIAAYFGM